MGSESTDGSGRTERSQILVGCLGGEASVRLGPRRICRNQLIRDGGAEAGDRADRRKLEQQRATRLPTCTRSE